MLQFCSTTNNFDQDEALFHSKLHVSVNSLLSERTSMHQGNLFYWKTHDQAGHELMVLHHTDVEVFDNWTHNFPV